MRHFCVVSIAKYLLSEINGHINPNPDPQHLQQLLNRVGDVDRQAELAQLIQAIDIAKTRYWSSISQWLDIQIPNITDIIIGGGTCRMFAREYREYIGKLPKIVGKPEIRQVLNGGLVYASATPLPPELRDRYADAWCLWMTALMPVVREYQGRKKLTAMGS